MKIKTTPIKDLYIIETNKIGDDRGAFMRMFCFDDIKKQTNINFEIKQINFSHTVNKGTVRGMHFQKAPSLESKIVRCIQGAIYDVAVDLRKDSPTYLQYFAIELSEENNYALLIPENFAHGFQSLTDDCKMVYLHNQFYTPNCEGGLRFDDAKLNINWPLKPINLSQRDLSFNSIE
jgi:dTDP-4-dehydrorhamnose 3,5-epimerase